tara:strand:- start:4670 stop:5476 length:807 start_codon:yes stop_codon:yes gene_type:complete
MSIGAPKPQGLSGYTLSSEYALAMIDWRDEKKRRQEAIAQLKPLDGETSLEFSERRAAMPQVRGWTEYALDPREDGAVTQPGSNAPMGLALNHPQNTDALVLKDWWQDSGTPGQEAEDIVLYKGEIKARTGGPSQSEYYTDYLMDEAVSPDIYIRTGMADYVPNLFNLFTDENGYRMDPAYIKGTGFWPTTKRAGMNLIQGGAGLLLFGFVGVFILKRFGVGIRETGVGAIDTMGGVVAEVVDEVGDLALTAKNTVQKFRPTGGTRQD